MPKDSPPLKIFIIAGESSGDMLGGKLINALKLKYPDINIWAVGGSSIASCGGHLVFDCQKIAVMGFWEVVPKAFSILMRIRQTVTAIEQFKPDILITIDSPGFNFRVVKQVRKRFGTQFPIIHYIAPTVWAYKKERAKLVAKLYDHIMLLLPFEAPYFDEVGMSNTYVGHPIIEDIVEGSSGESAINVGPTQIPILIMPGSRLQEIASMGKIFKKALKILIEQYHLNLMIMIPTKPNLQTQVQEIFGDLPNIFISCDDVIKQKFLKTAKLALVKSGTSSLEMAIHNIPCVVGYKISWLSYALIKRMIKIKYISLVNIILNRSVIPELIQSECNPKKLAEKLHTIYSSSKTQGGITRSYQRVIKLLGNNSGSSPSDAAAGVVLEVLRVSHNESTFSKFL